LMFETPEGKELNAGEHVPAGFERLRLDSPDELIDKRIKLGAISVYHPASTAAMGKVVDGSLMVVGA
ncbi:hypothetical protein GQ43DRAFT_372748, partial [Delitschia confertaspora ATCC 74209]